MSALRGPAGTANPRRLFNRFRHHAMVTVVSYDDEKRRLTYDPDKGAAGCRDRLQAGLDFDASDLKPGARLRIQYGEATRWTSTMHGGYRRLVSGGRSFNGHVLTGTRCINAIAHPNPRVTLLGLRAMEHVLGAEETAFHLGHFTRDASSLQTEIDEKATGKALSLRIEKGVLRADAVLLREPHLKIGNGFVQVRCGDLPETLVNALIGQHVGALVDHPALRDDEFTIERRHVDCSNSNFFLASTVLTVDEALARLRPAALPKAA